MKPATKALLDRLEARIFLGAAKHYDGIEAAALIREQAVEIEQLRLALIEVLPFVADEYFGCHGDKCRLPTCRSCQGEEEAGIAVEAATAACVKAIEVLGERACLDA